MNKIVFNAVQYGGSKILKFPVSISDIVIDLPDESGDLLSTNTAGNVIKAINKTIDLGLVTVEDLDKNTNFGATGTAVTGPKILQPAPPKNNQTDGNFRTRPGFNGTHYRTEWRVANDPKMQDIVFVHSDHTKPELFKNSFGISDPVLNGKYLQYRYCTNGGSQVSGANAEVCSPWSLSAPYATGKNSPDMLQIPNVFRTRSLITKRDSSSINIGYPIIYISKNEVKNLKQLFGSHATVKVTYQTINNRNNRYVNKDGYPSVIETKTITLDLDDWVEENKLQVVDELDSSLYLLTKKFEHKNVTGTTKVSNQGNRAGDTTPNLLMVYVTIQPNGTTTEYISGEYIPLETNTVFEVSQVDEVIIGLERNHKKEPMSISLKLTNGANHYNTRWIVGTKNVMDANIDDLNSKGVVITGIHRDFTTTRYKNKIPLTMLFEGVKPDVKEAYVFAIPGFLPDNIENPEEYKVTANTRSNPLLFGISNDPYVYKYSLLYNDTFMAGAAILYSPLLGRNDAKTSMYIKGNNIMLRVHLKEPVPKDTFLAQTEEVQLYVRANTLINSHFRTNDTSKLTIPTEGITPDNKVTMVDMPMSQLFRNNDFTSVDPEHIEISFLIPTANVDGDTMYAASRGVASGYHTFSISEVGFMTGKIDSKSVTEPMALILKEEINPCSTVIVVNRRIAKFTDASNPKVVYTSEVDGGMNIPIPQEVNNSIFNILVNGVPKLDLKKKYNVVVDYETNFGTLEYDHGSFLYSGELDTVHSSKTEATTPFLRVGEILTNLPDTLSFKTVGEAPAYLSVQHIDISVRVKGVTYATRFLTAASFQNPVTINGDNIPYDLDGVDEIDIYITTTVYHTQYKQVYNLTSVSKVDRRLKNKITQGTNEKIKAFQKRLKETTIVTNPTPPYVEDPDHLLTNIKGALYDYVDVKTVKYPVDIPYDTGTGLSLPDRTGRNNIIYVEYRIYDNLIGTAFFVVQGA